MVGRWLVVGWLGGGCWLDGWAVAGGLTMGQALFISLQISLDGWIQFFWLQPRRWF
jgi:hypothetical protein